MKIVYAEQYNIRIGPLSLLHRFDGQRFRRVYEEIRGQVGVDVVGPPAPIDDASIDSFLDRVMVALVRSKRPVLQALEVPYIPLLPFSFIDQRVLLPMRWAVAGTLLAARTALGGADCWNLSGGYHHASRHAAEGFCIYNDVGIACEQLGQAGELRPDDRILIVDVDAHHGNGNARVFDQSKNVVLLDVYNADIYPSNAYTRERVDVGVPLPSGTSGAVYLEKLEGALGRLAGAFKIGFVVAGTDVLASDPLGKLGLTVEDCAARDEMILKRLRALATPAVMLAGGGYSPESSRAMIASILRSAG